MEDRRWIRCIQNGDKQYLNNIAEKYYDDIYRFCCYQTGSPGDSYDLAQETFLRFIKYIENYQDRNLKGYLLTIASNICKDYFHKVNVKENCECIRESDDINFNERVYEKTTSNEMERTMVLLQALRQLPDSQREAIILHYYQELKYREIALLTGTKIATVKSRIKQGTDKLKNILRREDFYG